MAEPVQDRDQGQVGQEVKKCPMCGRECSTGQLLLKCVVCEAVYCAECQDQPTVHSFECYAWRRAWY